jgi:ABC-type sugar transport system ATPase subunit
MDEPTARLAPLERARLFAVMRQMCKERGVGIIYISHFLEEVREIADRITVLKDGRAVETGKSSNYTVDDLARLLVGHSDPLLKPKSDKRPEKQSETPSRAITITDVNAVGRPGWDITLHEGEILGIAGLVGSGRTTLMRAIVGEIGSSGHVQIGDKVLKKRTPKSMAQAGLVMVPEDRKISGLALQASIVANMEVTALAKRLSKFGIVRRAKTRAMVDDKIRSLRIMPPDLHKPVGLLSGGNAQKVLLGRALAAEPKVLILDQPTAGVDIGAKAEIHKVIISAAEASAAVILVSDDLDELLGLSDRIVVISEGRPQPALRADEFDRAELLAATSS